MSNTTTNPFFDIAAEKHKEAIKADPIGVLKPDILNQTIYTVGFCGGISYAVGIFQPQIEMMQTKIDELKKLLP